MRFVVYSRPMCSGCEAIKNKLSSAGITFEELDIMSPALIADLRCDGKLGQLDELVAPIVQMESGLGTRFFMHDEMDKLCGWLNI